MKRNSKKIKIKSLRNEGERVIAENGIMEVRKKSFKKEWIVKGMNGWCQAFPKDKYEPKSLLKYVCDSSLSGTSKWKRL